MNNYIENIVLINQYLNKSISKNETEFFLKKLDSDVAFKTLFTEQLELVNGIKREGLKKEIIVAKQLFIQAKWLKILRMLGLGATVIGFIYMTFFKTIIFNNKTALENNQVIYSDSINNIADLKTLQTIDAIQDETIQNKNTKIEYTVTERIEKSIVKDSLKVIVSKKEKQLSNNNYESYLELPVKSSQKVNIEKTNIKFLDDRKVQNILGDFVDDNKSGTYVYDFKGSNGNSRRTLILSIDGTFMFHTYEPHDGGLPSERNFYGKGTWTSNKNLVYFSTNPSDLFGKQSLDFNNTKARYNTKSLRDRSDRDIKTSLRFYESKVFWLKGMLLLKQE